MLESTGEFMVCGMAGSAQEALGLLSSVAVDVLLLDLRMPGMDGLAFMEKLRDNGQWVRVAVLTNYHSEEDVFRAFQAGAMAYLLKSASDEEMFTAIRAVHAGQRSIPPSIAHILAERLSRSELSAREQEVLRHVAKGLTNREIGKLLYISDKTVRNHVVSCLEKIGAKDRTEAIAIAIHRGLLAPAENS